MSASSTAMRKRSTPAHTTSTQKISAYTRTRAKENGEYAIATGTTRNWETNRLIRIMSRSLGMSRTRIGFAGTKDKRAITTQLKSFRCPAEDLAKVQLKDVAISDVYTGSRAIQLGDLSGNSFEITVRDCTMDRGLI